MDILDQIESDLIEAGKKVEMCKGREVEGMKRPTTDRTRFELSLEVLAALIAALRSVLNSSRRSGQSDPGSAACSGSGSDS